MQEEANGARSVSVLLIEHDLFQAQRASKLINDTVGFILVGIARTGSEAVEACKRLCPDIVLIDSELQQMDGFEAFELIKRLHPQISFILMTWSTAATFRMTAIRKGFCDVLTRPVERVGLTKALSTALSNAEVTCSERGHAMHAETETTQGIRVLMVEDNTINLRLYSRLIQRVPGLSFLGTADNGLEAVELCKTMQPEIVFMDIQMPEMDGITAAPLINELCPKTKIIAMTAHAMRGDVEWIMANGFCGYISKPFGEEMLHRVLFAVLTSSHPKNSEANKKFAKASSALLFSWTDTLIHDLKSEFMVIGNSINSIRELTTRETILRTMELMWNAISICQGCVFMGLSDLDVDPTRTDEAALKEFVKPLGEELRHNFDKIRNEMLKINDLSIKSVMGIQEELDRIRHALAKSESLLMNYISTMLEPEISRQ